MKKFFVFCFVLVFLVGSLIFVFSEPLPEDVELGFDLEGDVETNVIGNVLQIFLGSLSGDGDGLFKISDNLFEGVIPGVGDERSLINVDRQGNILEADLFVGDEGGSFLINGARFEVEPNQRFRYKQDKGYLLPDNTRIFDVLKSITVEGNNILFGDEAILDGKAIFEKDSFSVLSGKAILKDSNVEISPGSDRVKVFGSSVSESKVKSYSGNYIWKKDGGLEIKSSKDGRFGVEFLQGNGVLNVRENAYLGLDVSGGDGFEVNKVFGKNNFIYNSGDGYSFFRNGPNIISLSNEWTSIDSELNLDSVIDGKYLTAPAILSEGIGPDSTRYNFGKNSWKFNIFGNEESIYAFDGEIEDFGGTSLFSTYKNENIERLLNSGVGDAGLKEIASTLKENSGERAQGIFDYSVAHFLKDSDEIGFSETQKVQLLKKSSSLTGKYADELIFEMISPLENPEIEINNPNKVYDYYIGSLDILESDISGNLEDSKNLDIFLEKAEFAYRDIFPESIALNKDSYLSLSYLNKIFNSDLYPDLKYDEEFGFSYSDSPNQGYFRFAFDEYDGTNFNEIENGVEFLSDYGRELGMFRPLDLTISNMQDKDSFAREYAYKLNEKVSNLSPEDASFIADDLNFFHDIEGKLDGTDSIRESISEELSFESRYYLISGNLGSDYIYPSTFDLISEDIPDDFSSLVKQIDPSGDHSTAFTLELARRNKLEEVLDKDPYFFINSLQDGFNSREYVSIESEGSSHIFRNGVFSVDAIKEIWSNPDYRHEKLEMERFFSDKYNSASSEEERNFYAFFLEMNENPLLDSTNEVKTLYPDIDLFQEIPESISNKEIVSAKLYFEDDEYSYYNSRDFYGKFMNHEKSYTQKGGDGNDVSIYSLDVGDKKIQINLELGEADSPFSNSQEVLEGDTFDVVALRSHCYHQDDVLDPSFNILNEKIIFNGGCWSSTQLPDLQKRFPNMQFIVETDEGRGQDSDPAILEILKAIANGETNWEDISEEIPEGTGLSFPDDPNQILYEYIQQ